MIVGADRRPSRHYSFRWIPTLYLMAADYLKMRLPQLDPAYLGNQADRNFFSFVAAQPPVGDQWGGPAGAWACDGAGPCVSDDVFPCLQREVRLKLLAYPVSEDSAPFLQMW